MELFLIEFLFVESSRYEFLFFFFVFSILFQLDSTYITYVK